MTDKAPTLEEAARNGSFVLRRIAGDALIAAEAIDAALSAEQMQQEWSAYTPLGLWPSREDLAERPKALRRAVEALDSLADLIRRWVGDGTGISDRERAILEAGEDSRDRCRELGL